MSMPTSLLLTVEGPGFNVALKLPADFSVLHKACDAAYGDDGNDDEENYGAFPNRPNQSTPRQRPKPTIESRQVNKPVVAASSQPKTAHSERADEPAERENSSIARARENIASITKADCKNYFASAGMTLSVSCEK
jgi:hypothetical protein